MGTGGNKYEGDISTFLDKSWINPTPFRGENKERESGLGSRQVHVFI